LKRVNVALTIFIRFVSITLAAMLVWLLSRLVLPAIIERVVIRELRDLDFPVHTLNPRNLGTFLSSVEPRVTPFLSRRLLRNLNSRIRDAHSLRVQTAMSGVNGDDESFEYLAKSGLLEQIGKSASEARHELASMDCADKVRLPQRSHAEFYPSSPPPAPVRLPAEFEPIGGVILSFPVFYPRCWKTHTRLIKEIASQASAFVIVPNLYWQKAVLLSLEAEEVNLDNVHFLHFKTDDVWMRDYGPTTVFSGPEERPVFIWNPYCIADQAYYKFDADAAACLAMTFDVPLCRLPLIVEGGNLITDGRGTIIMSESVLNMNPDIDLRGVEKIMKDYFGCERLVMLPRLKGEITGHIDMVVKFINEDTLMVASAAEEYKWHDVFENAAGALGTTRSVTGERYRIIRAPIPGTSNSSRNFWSYVNSLTLNGKVIVPVFNVPEDDRALEIYRSCMPGCEVVGVDFGRFPLGSIHCQTKDLPEMVLQSG